MKDNKSDPKTRPEDLIERLRVNVSDLIRDSLSDLETLETLEIEETEDLTDWKDPISGEIGVLTLERVKAVKYRDLFYMLFERNSDKTPRRWRVNGQVKTWKTRPEEIRIPIKHGLYDYGYLTHDDLSLVSLSEKYASLDHNKKTMTETLIETLDLEIFSLQSLCIHIGDQIKDFDSDSGHSYIRPETLTDSQRQDLETVSRVSRGLSIILRKIVKDLQTGDPETLETLENSRLIVRVLFSPFYDPKDPEESDPERLTDPEDMIRELTPKTADLIFGTVQIYKEYRDSKSLTPKDGRS